MDIESAIVSGLGLAAALVGDLSKAKAAAAGQGVVVELEQLVGICLQDAAVKQSLSALLAAL